MAKAKKKENKLVIRKDNAVVQELVNDLTWHQNKLLCVLLGKYVNLEEDELVDSQITVVELIHLLNLKKTGTSYDFVYKAINDFGGRGAIGILTYNEKTGKERYIWIPYFTKIVCEDGFVTFTWNREMEPFLLHLKENYTQYLASNYLPLTTVYAQNLYEWAKSMENYERRYRQKPTVTMERLREIMQVEDGRYPTYNSFRTSCLVRAILNINKVSDIHIEVETLKDGKDVKGFAFKITSLRGDQREES